METLLYIIYPGFIRFDKMISVINKSFKDGASHSVRLLLMKNLECFFYKYPLCAVVQKWHCFKSRVRAFVGYSATERVQADPAASD